MAARNPLARPARVLPAMLLACAGMALASPARAQHELTPADVQEGRQLFRSTCTQCHGADGDAVLGVDLTHGQFRGSTTDADLVRVIRTGLPGTGMPPGAFTESQAANIVAYLRSLVSTPTSFVPGDARRGQGLFEGKGACASCHRVAGTGGRLGPDLTEIGQLRTAPDLERSLIDPGAEVIPTNRHFRVVGRDGTITTGRLLNYDSFTVQLLDGQQRLRSFDRTALKEAAFVDKSPMPSARDKLSAGEITDVVRYLVTLKGVTVRTP
jgi:putative heme-binding domain-containing protein